MIRFWEQVKVPDSRLVRGRVKMDRHQIDLPRSLPKLVGIGGMAAMLFLVMALTFSCNALSSGSVERTAAAQQTFDSLVLDLHASETSQAQMETLVAQGVLATLTAQPTATPTPTLTVLPALPALRETPALPAVATRISPRGNAVQIHIPSGAFIMGSNSDQGDRAPMHAVYLDAFWIDLTQVTNAQFALCVEAGACAYHVSFETNPRFTDPAYADHPVVYVTWQDAVDYCTWEGGRLPTEAEWEAAARGPYGRTHPWGEEDPSPTLANVDGYMNDTTPVGSHPAGASYYGVLDMVGNVREWVSDWYDPNYYWDSPARNPQGPETGEKRVLRGSCFSDPASRSLASTRYAHVPSSAGATRGFRCAASIP
jgi:formylglycine-generating enzyme required for sulfatase activity